MSNQNNLNYLIDPTFTNVNRLYVLSFENGNDPTFTNVNRLFVLSFENENDRTSLSKYYAPKVEIKEFNVLIDGKPFFEIPVKNKEEAYEQIIEMSQKNGYFKDHYQLNAIDLSKKVELENPDLK